VSGGGYNPIDSSSAAINAPSFNVHQWEEVLACFALTLSLAAYSVLQLTVAVYLDNDLHQFEIKSCFLH